MTNTKNTNYIWTNILNVITQRKQVLTLIHLFYSILTILIFTPILGLIGQIMLKLSGKDVMSDMQIAGFILSPLGFISFLIFFSLLVTIIIFEQASMQAVTLAKEEKGHISAISSIGFVLKNASKIFMFSNRLILKLLITMLPFLAVAGIVAFLLISKYDINYYLTQKPSEFIAVVAINSFIILLMSIVVVRKLISWSLALPLTVFSDVKPVQSFSKSAEMTKNHKKEIFLYYLKWALVSVFITVIVLAIVNFIGDLVAVKYLTDIKILIMIIGLFAVILWIVTLLITIFTSASFASLTVLLANKYGADINTDSLNIKELSSSWELNKTKIAIVTILLLLASIVMGSQFLNSSQEIRNVDIFAHRGAAGKAPENTMAAFKQAIEDKSDWIELDVQESKDGEIVVVHDSDLMKLANSSPKIWESTKDELQQIDIGSWFDPKFSNERVPTLRDVLTLAKGKINVLIELKYYGHDIELEKKVVELIEEFNMMEDVALMSLKAQQVEKVRVLRPHWKTGLLLSKTLGDISKIDVDFLAVNLAMMSPSFVKRTHDVGKKLYVWTADDPITIFKMLTIGVDGIITNEPELARKVIEARKELNPMERFILHTAVILGKELPKKEYRDDLP